MTIDWFTTGAQIINFLILVWLLKKLLFRPIISAMEDREQNLSNRFQQAETKMSEAQTLKHKYQQHLQQLQTEKDQIFSEARLQAENEKTHQLQTLSKEIEQRKNQFDAEMRLQQQELGPLISKTIAEKSLTLSHKTLTRLVDQTLEQRIIEHFLHHLSDFSDEKKASVRHALAKDNPAIITTHFKLDTTTQQQIQSWFDNFSPGSKLLFEQGKYLLSGIALEADGRSWEWTIDRYLTELGTELL